MNKTRFQMPPRADSAVGVDHWITGETATPASRRADAKIAFRPSAPDEMFAPMKFPFMFDWTTLLVAQRRNIEAMTAANRVVVEGAQAVVRRNLEIMQQAVESVSKSLQAMPDLECPGERAMRQTEAAINAYEEATGNVRELREIIQHAGTEAMEVLSKRFADAADEVKSLARSTTREFWDSGRKPAPFWQQT
jgi:phasin family protein